MAFKTFVDAVALPASDLNTYLMKQTVIVCTSGTRPSSPPEGMTIYETDTDKLLVYTTATTTWQQPWNMPWGRIGSASVTADQNTISAQVDLTSLTVTATTVANRRVRVSAHCAFQQSTSASATVLYILRDGVQIQRSVVSAYAATAWATHTPFTVTVPTAASHTWKLQASTGANTMNLIASATDPAFILVEDIGPDSAPA